MPTRTTHLIAAGAAAFGLSFVPSTLADHIPGHDDDDPIFPVPIPGQEHFDGGIMFVTAIGPEEGNEITNTRFDVTFVSDGQTPASDLLIEVGLFVDTGPGGVVHVETHVTGADLGFGAGPGTFHGTFETTELNGITVPGFFPPDSLVDLAVGATSGGIDGSGYFVDSFIYFDLAMCPWDVDADATVGFGDLLTVLSAWGEDPGGPPDFDGNGTVDFSDLLEVLANWGPCP